MSSGPLRRLIGPLSKTLRDQIAEAGKILSAENETLTNQQISRLKSLRNSIQRASNKLEQHNMEWMDYMGKLPTPEAVAAEEAIYENFQRPAAAPVIQAAEEGGEDAVDAGNQEAPPEFQHFSELIDQGFTMVEVIIETLGEDQNSSHRNREEDRQSAHSSHQNSSPYHSFKIPPMEIPKFSGDSEKFATFWQCFEFAIHDNENIPVGLKIHHLCNSLQGEAASAVSGYPRIAENYKHVVDLLQKRYGSSTNLRETLQSELLRLPPAKDTAGSLRTFCDAVERICRQLEAQFLSLGDASLIVTAIKSKLPLSLIEKIVAAERASKDTWTYTDLRKFLLEQLAIKEDVERVSKALHKLDIPKEREKEKGSKHKQPSSSHRTFSSVDSKNEKSANGKERKFPCSLCISGDHFPSECPHYPTPAAKKAKLIEQNRCTNCLREGHNVGSCESVIRCKQCKGKHNIIICTKGPLNKHSNKTQKGGKVEKDKKSVNFQSDNKVTVAQSDNQSNVTQTDNQSAVAILPQLSNAFSGENPDSSDLLMTTEFKVATGRSKQVFSTIGFWDPGANVSYISHKFAEKIRAVKIGSSQMKVNIFGANTIEFDSNTFQLKIQRLDGKWEEVILKGIDVIIPPFTTASWKGDGHSASAEEVKANIVLGQSEPGILLGLRYFWRSFVSRRPIHDDLWLVTTQFGNIICGDLPPGFGQISSISIALPITPYSSNENLPTNSEIKQFWDLESMGILEENKSSDDQIAEKLVENSIEKEENGRYSVRLPWKLPPGWSLEDGNPGPPENISSNFEMSYKRLSSVVKRLKDIPGQEAKKCHQIFLDQLDTGIIEQAELSPEKLESFMPHHPVFAHGKIRMVADASAHSKNKPSLNQCLYRGPVLLNDILGMLLRFRGSPIPILADIEKAFHQIILNEKDRDLCKFLWVKNGNLPLVPSNLAVYRYKRIAFGIISSPYLLAAVINFHLKSIGTPLAQQMAKNIYVDNLLLECEEEDEAIEYAKKAKEIFTDARMNLREFVSHIPAVVEKIPPEDRLGKLEPNVLGIPWNLDSDCLIFRLPSFDFDKGSTRRTISSAIASCFDPLGLISPCLLQAKIFNQKLWGLENFNWDKSIPPEEEGKWKKIVQEWETGPIKVPRPTESNNIQIHIFTDASNLAYGAVLYIRSINSKIIETHIIFSKNRLRPLNPPSTLTIPRMELLGILAGVRAKELVKREIRRPIEKTVLWSDSQIALCWLKEKEGQKTWVENRVREIRSHEDIEFRYVRTFENPADFVTRGMSANQLRHESLWWKGPEWLKKEEEFWPNEFHFNLIGKGEEKIMEKAEIGTFVALLKPPQLSTQIQELPLIDPRRFSTWIKLQGTIIWVLRFLKAVFAPCIPISHPMLTKQRKLSLKNASGKISPFSIHPLILQHRKEILDISEAKFRPTFQFPNTFEATDFNVAKSILIRLDQMDHLEEIGKYNCVEGNDKIFRVVTRLMPNYEGPRELAHPIFLARHSAIRRLIIADFHAPFSAPQRTHSTIDITLTEFLCQFYTPRPNGRSHPSSGTVSDAKLCAFINIRYLPCLLCQRIVFAKEWFGNQWGLIMPDQPSPNSMGKTINATYC